MNIPIVECPLVDANGALAPFKVVFYGIAFDKFLEGDGGHRISAALDRRGVEGLVSSPFLIRERRLVR